MSEEIKVGGGGAALHFLISFFLCGDDSFESAGHRFGANEIK